MSHDTIEPLEPGTWLIQLRNLAAKRPADEPSLAAALRRAFHLVQLTPRPLRHVIACKASEPDFDRLLERGAWLDAARALIGEELRYALAPASADGLIRAEVRFPGEPACSASIGRSPALALFAAWLECLLTLTQPDPVREDTPRAPVRFPGPRRSRSARRPRLTEH